MAFLAAYLPPSSPRDISSQVLQRSVQALAATAWLSGAIFGTYILFFYAGAIPAGTPDDWNAILPGLYEKGGLAANIGIGVHFALGAVLLLLGPVQLIAGIRARWPRLHHWIGRIYIASALLTGLGGLGFIALRGTVGGPIMSLGFSLYGVLMVLCALQALRHAMARRIDRHRAWAIRLFSLAIGSWLYRMDYGFWFLFFGPLGHTESFTGPFDYFMDFWFYLPNLLVAEVAIRAASPSPSRFLRWASSSVLGLATVFLLLATYFFTTRSWGLAILWRLGIG